MSARELEMARFGRTLILVGLLALILPHFGLQVRRLARAGEFVPYIGTLLGLIGSGLVFAGYRRQMKKALVLGAGSASLLIVMSIVSMLIAGAKPASDAPVMARPANSELGQRNTGGDSRVDAAGRSGQSKSERDGPSSRRTQPPSKEKSNRSGNGTHDRDEAQEKRPSQSAREPSNQESGVDESIPTDETRDLEDELAKDMEKSIEDFRRKAAEMEERLRRQNPDPEISSPRTDARQKFDRHLRDRAGKNRIVGRLRELHKVMDRELGLSTRIRFPAEFLTPAVGVPSGMPEYYVHPQRQPVVGIMIASGEWMNENAISIVGPVYDRDDADATLFAREGYALAGIDVHADEYVRGIQFIFMKLQDQKYDTTDVYESEWFGIAAAEGQEQRLGADGRAVFGIWMHRAIVVKAVGLIIDE